MYVLANEPSVALYRLQEHVRRSLPELVQHKVIQPVTYTGMRNSLHIKENHRKKRQMQFYSSNHTGIIVFRNSVTQVQFSS